jgi:2-polyprenyl-6-methoxyphenol hydroxylase-like FAD-dependent oxidoreductase
VAIVGAGAVGLLLACLLARRGLDVVVLERRRSPGGRTRAIGIHPPGLAALYAAGVGAELRDAATPILRGIALCRGDELGRLTFDSPVLSVPQQRTEELLERRLAALAPGALRRGVAVTDVRQRRSLVELAVDGVDEPLRARVCVGADGIRSTVRRRLGVAWRPRRGSAHYAMVDAASEDGGPPDAALLHLEPDGVVESFPLPEGRRRWVVRLPHRAAPAPEEFADLIARRVGAAIPPTSVPSAFTARQHVAATFARGRVVLAGDAAHEVSPIGGQGMNLGWLDALHLDRAIASGLRAGSPAPRLRRWARRRRAAARRATRRALFNMTMGAPATGPLLGARNALVRVLTRGPAATLLARMFTMRGL